MEIGQRIKTIRKELKLTQTDFASKLNLEHSHISNLENGRKTPTDRVIDDICRVYDVNKDWLANEEGEIFLVGDSSRKLAEAIAKISLSDNYKLKEIVKKIGDLDEEYIDALNIFVDGLLKK